MNIKKPSHLIELMPNCIRGIAYLCVFIAVLTACTPNKQVQIETAESGTTGSDTTQTDTTRSETTQANTFAKASSDDIVYMSLPEIIDALESGQVTSVQLVEAYLARIDNYDKNGPVLQSVLSINPDALELARLADEQRRQSQSEQPTSQQASQHASQQANQQVIGALHGVPILLKDNIDSADPMPTTAGALALLNNYRDTDSPLVRGLRDAGAIILGKTNLSQWANFRSQGSMSGWSALGGQVKNPHLLTRNPCGSSSGSGAATAASLAAASVGTETNGSIICPSNVNGVVGFKPTVGLVSQQGIVPISASQDTAGPMTKSVEGAALMMNAMASSDAKDSVDFTAYLNKQALNGKKVGVMRFAVGENKAIIALFERALEDMQNAGAELVEIDTRPELPDGFWGMSYELLKTEFKHGLNEYLATTKPAQVEVRSLSDLITFNEENTDDELALFDQSIFVASQQTKGIETEEYLDSVKVLHQAVRQDGIDHLLEKYNVDVLVSPSGVFASLIDPVNGDVWPSDWPGYGSAAAIAGYPHITVPMGVFRHLPVGVSFIASANEDAELLGFAYAYEQHSNRRVRPQFLPSVRDDQEINRHLQAMKTTSRKVK